MMATPTPTPFISNDGAVLDVDAKCYISAVAGSVSIISCAAVLVLYIKARATLRRPILDCLVYCFALAIPSNINIVASSILRLKAVHPSRYCNVSGFSFQQFTLPEIIMEGVFFGSMGWTLLGGRVTYVGVRKALAVALAIGTLAALIPMGSLEVMPSTDTVWVAGMPWCWLPDNDHVSPSGTPTASVKLTVYKLVFGYLWASAAILIGLTTLFLLLWKNLKAQVAIPWSVKSKWMYWLFFATGWTLSLIPRFFEGSLEPQTESHFQMILAFVAPGLPFVNAILFILCEGIIAMSRGEQSSVAGYDDMRDEASTRHSVNSNQTTDTSNGAMLSLESALFQVRQQHGSAVADETIQRNRAFSTIYAPTDQEWLILVPHGATEEEAKVAESTLRSEIGPDKVVKLLDKLSKPPIGVALSFVAGYSDALTFIYLGIFSAHVTGNFVLIAVQISSHNAANVSSIIEKLVALPVFCGVIAIVHGFAPRIGDHHRRFMLITQAVCFFVALTVACLTGPYKADELQSAGAYTTAMFMIAGMAVQNSYQRAHLVGLPMTAFMTGNTNQMVHDVVDMARKKMNGDPSDTFTPFINRCKNSGMNVLAFFIGAMLAGLALRTVGHWAFAVPGMAVLLVLALFWEETAMPAKKK